MHCLVTFFFLCICDFFSHNVTLLYSSQCNYFTHLQMYISYCDFIPPNYVFLSCSVTSLLTMCLLLTLFSQCNCNLSQNATLLRTKLFILWHGCVCVCTSRSHLWCGYDWGPCSSLPGLQKWWFAETITEIWGGKKSVSYVCLSSFENMQDMNWVYCTCVFACTCMYCMWRKSYHVI